VTSEKKRAYMLAYKETHREALKEKRARHYADHREEELIKNRAYHAAHREELLAYQRRYMYDHYRAAKQIETYVVYAGPEVIYVGRTDHFGMRQRNHRVRSPWFDEMTDIHHRHHASYADSLVDEALLIRLHQPKYNQEGVTR
jgi:hypothetical protein